MPSVVTEQSVAPIQRGSQGLLARRRCTAATHKESNSVIESLEDLRDPERPHPSRSEADSQWQAVDRLQMRAIAGACVEAVKSDADACARSTKSWTAADRSTSSDRALRHERLPSDASRQRHTIGWQHYLERLALVASGKEPGPDW